MHNIPSKYRTGFIYAALTLATLAVFWQVHRFEFLNYDDQIYVDKNEHISPGLTREGIVWVFTHAHGNNWHPLTGLSHMLDCELFGLDAGWHHMVNVLFHIANTLLLFTVLRQMTGAIWQSAFTAALFALHPLHVESVTWISERKDVLSTLFLLLTLAAYFRYVKHPKAGWYILSLVFFSFGLMSKPMLVTLPFVLLLLDYWPLERLNRNNLRHLIFEKMPFFVFASVSSVVTLLVQQSTGAVANIQQRSFDARLGNGVLSYIRYIQKMFWPSKLAVIYPVPGEAASLFQVLGAALLLLIISVLVICFFTKYKYLFVGWFWYLGTLVPVIGVVQVGTQTHADRYTYISLAGLFIIAAWGFNDLLVYYHFRKKLSALIACTVLSVLAICSTLQIRYWRNSLTLFEHAAAVTNKNYIAHTNIGFAIMDQNRLDEAINHFREALRIRPGDAEAYNALGAALTKLGRFQEAAEACRSAIKIRADYAEAYNNLGTIYIQLGRCEEAIEVSQQAIRIMPNYPTAYSNIGVVYTQLGRWAEAIEAFKQAVKIKPDYAKGHFNLGLAYVNVGDREAAMAQYEILKPLDPESAEALRGFIK